MWWRHINQMHSTENSTTIQREQAQRAPESDTQGTVEDGGAVERPQAERMEHVEEGAAIAEAIMEQAHNEDVQEPPDTPRRYPEGRHQTDWTYKQTNTNKNELFKFKSKDAK